MNTKLTVTIHSDKDGGHKAVVKSNRSVAVDYISKRFASLDGAKADAEIWINDNTSFPISQVRFNVVTHESVPTCGKCKTPLVRAVEHGLCAQCEDQRETVRPVLTACVDCGENAPESGMVCDNCREDALGD